MIKKVLVISILLFILSSSFTSIIKASKIDFISDFEFKNDFDLISINSFKQSKILIIEKIEDGFGLKIFIKNIGDETVQNCVLKTEIIEGSSLVLYKKYINIPSLNPGETWQVHMKSFGFSFGMFSPFSMITFSFDGIDILPYEWGIITNIVGPYTNILGNYFNSPFSSEGYTLFAPELSTKTYLIDNHGRIIHIWESKYIQALGVYLLENGCIVRTALSELNPIFWSGGLGGRLEIIDWNGALVWEFEYASNEACLHSDVAILPNGNILMTAWEYKSYYEAIAAGRNPSLIDRGQLWPDHIIEVKPIGSNEAEIVWEWHAWDHLIQDYDSTKNNYGNVSAHPELIDINYASNIIGPDWMHTNSIDYNEEFDQILISVKNFNEIWIIDHSTTSEEASGHSGGRYGKGGDLLYRWGNPQTYRAGNESDQKLFGQHDAQWIDNECPGEGNILVFNNGWDIWDWPDFSGRGFSSIDEIVTPVNNDGFYQIIPDTAFGPEEPIWTYTSENPNDFFSLALSGCQRLPNGNTIICHGYGGFFFEVTLDKDFVWLYTNQFPLMEKFNLFPYVIQGNQIYKIRRYPLDYLDF